MRKRLIVFIINAYEIKTGLSRAKLAHLMDAETWMDANKALELGFIDGILARETAPTAVRAEEDDNKKDDDPDEDDEDTLTLKPSKSEPQENNTAKTSMLFSRKAVEVALMNKMRHRMIAEAAKIQPKETTPTGRKVDDLYDRLNLLKH